MPILTINGVRYAYDDIGRGPALMLLHGFTGSRAGWAEGVAILQRDFRVITVDLLGHGQTEAPADPKRYQMEHAAADLITLADALDTGLFNLLGYSMGGRLALYITTTYQRYVKRLILESASPGLDSAEERHARKESDDRLAERIERHGIEPFVDFWEALPLWHSQTQLTPSQRENLHAQRLQNRPHGLAHSLRGMGTGVQPSVWDQLPALKTPTLLVAGALDSKFVALNQKMAALLPNGTLQIVPEAGHTVHLERPQPFWTLVCDFLQEGTAVGE